jgi:Tol biopolymer transport system component
MKYFHFGKFFFILSGIFYLSSGFATACNNDHVLAASGNRIAISHGTKEDGQSRIYILPLAGGSPTLITPLAPSYLHGWSPDGTKVVFIAYQKDDVKPGDHPPGKNVELCLMPANGGETTTLVRLFGGQGTMNVNSWSPDSKCFAFVSYLE